MAEEGNPPRLSTVCISSVFANTLMRSVCHPLDTAKARMQAATGNSSVKGLRHTIRSMWAHGGFRCFYRGFGTVIVGGAPGTCLYLATYELAKSRGGLMELPLLKSSAFLRHFLGGMLAETVCCIVYVPVDVIKERLQVQNEDGMGRLRYRGSLHALRTILAEEGVRGIYKGYGATLASFGPMTGLYFVVYEQAKKRLQSLEQTFSLTLATAAFSGAVAAWVTSPLDLVKLRLQVERGVSALETSHSRQYRNIAQGLSVIYRREGLRGLYRGAVARVAFSAPASALVMAAYERLVYIIRQQES